jgi:hypothetical protein
MFFNVSTDWVRFALHKIEDQLLAAHRELATNSFALTAVNPNCGCPLRVRGCPLGVDADVTQILKMFEDDYGGFFQVGSSLLSLLLDLFQRPKQALNGLLLHPFGFLQQPLNVGSDVGHYAFLSFGGESLGESSVLFNPCKSGYANQHLA